MINVSSVKEVPRRAPLTDARVIWVKTAAGGNRGRVAQLLLRIGVGLRARAALALVGGVTCKRGKECKLVMLHRDFWLVLADGCGGVGRARGKVGRRGSLRHQENMAMVNDVVVIEDRCANSIIPYGTTVSKATSAFSPS